MDLLESLVRDRVSDLQMRPAVTVATGTSVGETIALMQRERVGCVLVLEQDGLGGLFTERDVVKRVLAEGAALDEPVSAVMTRSPATLSMTHSVADVIRAMHTGGYRHMPVVDESGDILGVLSVKRVVRYLVEHFPAAVYNLPPDPTGAAMPREGG